MGTITIRVSDLSGKQIPDDQEAGRLVVEHPDFPEPITMEVLPEEIEEKLPEGTERFVSLSYVAPRESTPHHFLLPITEFNNLFEDPDQEEEGILDKLSNLLFGQQQQKPSRGRQRGGRRRQAQGSRERINWASPERAGTPHPGTISVAEKAYVREHLDEVNERLRGRGIREIDPTDPEMAERYGLVQEPVEAEIVEERPPPPEGQFSRA